MSSCCPPCCFPFSTFHAHVPSAGLSQHPHHAVHPCCLGFSFQIFPDPSCPFTLSPIKAYPLSVALPLALLPAEGHLPHSATEPMGNRETSSSSLVTYLCFPGALLELWR